MNTFNRKGIDGLHQLEYAEKIRLEKAPIYPDRASDMLVLLWDASSLHQREYTVTRARIASYVSVLRGRNAHPMSRKNYPTINLGEIRAGNHPGTMPGYCRALIDIRLVPGLKSRDEIIHDLSSLLRRHRNEHGLVFDSGIKTYSSGGYDPILGYDTKKNALFVRLARAPITESRNRRAGKK